MNRSFSGTSRTLASTTRTQTVSMDSFLGRILRRGSGSSSENTNQTLEDVIDVSQDLNIFSDQQLRSMQPRTLYGVNRFSRSTSLFRHQRTEPLQIPDNHEVRLTLMTEESSRFLLARSHNYIHLGLIIIGIRGLTMKGKGGKALLVLYDSRFSEQNDQIIGMLEIDLTNNLGITYVCPNFNMTIKDFCKHIKILVKTRGYGQFEGSNVQLDMIFLGKL